MKKLIVFCISVVLVFIVFGQGHATVIRGTWDLNSTPIPIENGFWTEFFNTGGPGSPGNHLTAGDGLQWQLRIPMMVISTTPTGPGEFETVFSGGQLDLQDGPWGGPVTVTDLEATSQSSFDALGNLEGFLFSLVGKSVGVDWGVTATFVADASNYVRFGDNFQNGVGFETLEVSAIPEPATMLLLGFGFVGITAFRKKFSKI